jgi:RecB family exonuclease
MAEHARHKLARAGFAVRPRAIQTLAQLLDEWAPQGEAPKPLLHLLISQALERIRPARFAEVAAFPGFVRALADLFDEIPGVDALSGDLARLYGDVAQELGARSLAFRNARILAAADRFRPAGRVDFEGFFTLNAAEAALVRTLSGGTGVQPVDFRQSARKSAFSAATIEREVEEIARRILERTDRGRLFREMAIVLRAQNPYGPLVETTLARFGIPARLYFSDPLGSHPVVMYLASVVRAMLAGWDHAALLAAIRMPVSGIGATPFGDQLDFEWRAKLPAIGLPGVPDRLVQFDSWRRERHDPQEWAERLKTLRTLVPQPEIADRVTRDQVYVWRSTTAALAAFDEALDGVAAALTGACSLETFWKQAELAIALEPLRVPDQRRNVVHVMDAYEARQWELPVVFVCGLTERHFPQYHREDSIIGDAARKRMGLDTAISRQSEERFLFDIATTRATEETVLSYPRYDEKGEETLPSFFLDGTWSGLQPATGASAPAPGRRLKSPLQAEACSTSDLHKTLSPSSIESFLQCPFQFFAKKTLRLRPRPPAPRDRLDVLLQGNIIHRALAEWALAPLLGAAILEQVFEEECARVRIPPTYRTEAVRLELLRNFRGFIDDHQVALPSSVRTEEKFSFPLNPLVAISGRIDRIDISPGGQALVIDYKYSAADKIREHVKASDAGDRVQAGLYLLAAERFLGLDPIGMLFCGLKKEVTWEGWHRDVPELRSVGTAGTQEVLRDLMKEAERTALRTHEEISSGRIAVSPADRKKCEWCDYRDICRIESMPAVKATGGS